METKPKIEFQKKRAVRERRVEVKLSSFEYAALKNANASSIARLLRESALNAVNEKETQTPKHSSFDRELILELSRIGNNINQIAKAINTDLAARQPLDAAMLLHLLIGIDQALKSLRNDS